MVASANSEARGRRQDSQRGIALIAVLLALLVVTILGLALNASGVLSLNISTNERHGAEALYLADAGAAHARRMLIEMIRTAPPPPPGASVLDQFLAAGDGVPCNGDELSPAPPAPFSASDAIPFAGVALPAGSTNRYRVAVCDDDGPAAPSENGSMLADVNGAILIRSFGAGQNGAAAVVEVVISRVPLPGLLVDGNLRINGNPAITGAGGAVHSNGNLDLPGVPCAEDYFSSSGTVTASGETGSGCASTPPNGSDSTPDERPGQTSIPIPPIQPSDYRPYADWILRNDGQLIQVSTGLSFNSVQAKTLFDWDWDPGNRRWIAGNNIPAGTVYADDAPSGVAGTGPAATNIEVSSNPGSGVTPPPKITLIATGFINISGNPSFAPDTIVGGMAISMVAGTDLKINGNPATVYQGLHFAGHQIDFSGDPIINGQVIAANKDDFGTPQNLTPLKSGAFMEVSGNPIIHYTGAGGLSSLGQTGWRECRGTANPANPCQ